MKLRLPNVVLGLYLLAWPIYIGLTPCSQSAFADWVTGSYTGYILGSLSLASGMFLLVTGVYPLLKTSKIGRDVMYVVAGITVLIAASFAFYNAFSHCLIF